MSETKDNATVMQNVENSEAQPDIYKEAEFQTMLKFIRLGMWRNTNLAKVCHVSVDTLTEWKKRPEVAAAYNEAVEWIVKKRKNISDPEKIMKEMGLEVDKNESELTVKVIPLLGGASAHAIPSNTSDAQIVEANETD